MAVIGFQKSHWFFPISVLLFGLFIVYCKILSQGYSYMFIRRAPTPKNPGWPNTTGPKPHQLKTPTPKTQFKTPTSKPQLTMNEQKWKRNVKNNPEKKYSLCIGL